MAKPQKIFLDQANYREIAGLWFRLGTILGLLGLLIASLAIIWIAADDRSGRTSLVELLLTLTFFSGFALGPVAGWILFARRWYWAAMAPGGFRPWSRRLGS